MSTFNEEDHPRGGDGKFSTKQQGEVDPGFGEDLDAAVAAAKTLSPEALAEAALATKALDGTMSWSDLGGVDDAAASRWEANNFDPASAYDWMSAGIGDPQEAYDWSGEFCAEEAGEWKAGGFGAAEAAKWDASGFAPADAADWKDAQFQPLASQRWAMRHFDPSDAREWSDGGFDPKHAQMWRSAGLEPTGIWAATRLELGVTPDDAREWRNTGRPPAEIQRRIDRLTRQDGVSPLDRYQS